jgi:hypothetical protein
MTLRGIATTADEHDGQLILNDDDVDDDRNPNAASPGDLLKTI